MNSLPAANTLLGEDPSASRADQWQLLHQADDTELREVLHPMLGLPNTEGSFPCAADKDPRAPGMFLTSSSEFL